MGLEYKKPPTKAEEPMGNLEIPSHATGLLLYSRRLGLDGFTEFTPLTPRDSETLTDAAHREWEWERSRSRLECGEVTDPHVVRVNGTDIRPLFEKSTEEDRSKQEAPAPGPCGYWLFYLLELPDGSSVECRSRVECHFAQPPQEAAEKLQASLLEKYPGRVSKLQFVVVSDSVSLEPE